MKYPWAALSTGRAWAGFRYRLGEAAWARSLRLRPTARPRPLAERTETERNIHYLYVEIFWAAIFSAVFAFNATYALRLGATNQMVGWLSSLPSLFAMVMMVPAARFLESRKNSGPWLYVSLALGRVGFLSAAFVPWLFPNRAAQVVIYLFVLRTIPITVFNTGFSPMLADVIPERDRARVFANRNIILSGVTAAVTFLSGRWLDGAAQWHWADFPFNYQLLYILGGIAALASAYYVTKVKPPPRKAVAPKGHRADPQEAQEGDPVEAPPARPPLLARARIALHDLRFERRDFMRITTNTLLFNLGAWLVMPLYIILFVKQLEATDSWIGLNSTLANLGVIAGYALWRPWINRLGDNRVLRLTAPLAASYAFLVALFPNLTLILIWGILINLINPGVNLAHTNVFYRVCPEERRASYMAFYSSVMNAGAFVCPMIGVALSDVIDIRWVLLIGGVIRLLGAFMFHILRLEEGAPQ
jgi:MFS family permease